MILSPNKLSAIAQVLPDFKGKRRLFRKITSAKAAEFKNLKIKAKNGLVYRIPNIEETIGFELFINGVYEKNNVDLLKFYLGHDGNFIDVGANIGAITLPVAKERKESMIYSIEASPRVYGYLCENVAMNDLSNVKPINVALSDSNQDEIGFFNPEDKYGKGSLTPVFTSIPELVHCMRLDDLIIEHRIEKVSVMKLDVEGHESKVLLGGIHFLQSQSCPKVIMMEFVDWAEQLSGSAPGYAQKILIDLGYELYGISEKKKMDKLKSIQYKGSAMIWAIKP